MRRHNKSYHIVAGFLLYTLVILFGCGSDLPNVNDEGPAGDLAVGGQSGTGFTSGSIDGFGSIYVNDIRFDTTHADIYIEGEHVGTGDEALTDLLNVGQIVHA